MLDVGVKFVSLKLIYAVNLGAALKFVIRRKFTSLTEMTTVNFMFNNI